MQDKKRMPGTGTYLQSFVRCPFYRRDDGKRRIVCEGIIDDSSICLIFRYDNLFNYRKFKTRTITGDKTALEIISNAKLPIASAQNTAIPETVNPSVDAIWFALSIKKK